MVSWTRPVLNSLHSSGLMNSMAPVEKPQAGPSRQGLPLDAWGEVRPSGSQTLPRRRTDLRKALKSQAQFCCSSHLLSVTLTPSSR